MFGLETLEVAIGLIFLFFILSLLLTSLREALEGLLQTRAIHLERGIRELLKDKDGTALAREFYEHPLISSLYRGDYPTRLRPRLFTAKDDWPRPHFRSNLPSYIPARNFALALLDLAGRGLPSDGVTDRELDVARIREGMAVRIAEPKVRRAVMLALDQAKGDLDQAKANLEAWFDSGMDRVAGWYRKETQWILLALGLIAAAALNIDTLRVARALYENDALRSTIVADAQAFADAARREGVTAPEQERLLRLLGCGPALDRLPYDMASLQLPAAGPGQGAAGVGAAAAKAAPDKPPAGKSAVPPTATKAALENASCAEQRIRKLGLPIGWHKDDSFGLSTIPGWLLTALAISLGAPFWFDLLNKIMVIRSTVKPHEKSPEEDSEDRQLPRGARRDAAAAPAPPPSIAPQPLATAAGEPNRIEADEMFAPGEWDDKIDPKEDEA